MDDDGVNFFRGLIVAAVVSVLLWVLIWWGVSWLIEGHNMKPIMDIIWALVLGGGVAGVIYLIKLGYETFTAPTFVDEDPPF